jgi:hypothetical protein
MMQLGHFLLDLILIQFKCSNFSPQDKQTSFSGAPGKYLVQLIPTQGRVNFNKLEIEDKCKSLY